MTIAIDVPHSPPRVASYSFKYVYYYTPYTLIYIGCVSASERKEIPVPASPTVVVCAEEKADRLTQLSPRR